MGSNKTFKTKVKLSKAARTNRPVPQWFRIKSKGKVSYNMKMRNWRHTKLNI